MPFRILVALGVEIFAAIGCVVSPYLGFVFFVFFTILRPQDDRPNVQGLHYPMVLLLSVLLGCVPRMVRSPEFSVFFAAKRLILILLLYFLMIASALATGFTPDSSYRIDEFLVVVITCFLIVYWGKTVTHIWGILAAFVVAGLQISRDAVTRTSWIHEQIGEQHFDRMNMNHLNGNFGSPNYIALLMALLILVSLNFLYTRYSKWLKFAAVGCIGLFFLVFLKANSRGATLGLAASLIVFWLFQKRKAVSLAALTVILLAVVAFAPAAYFDRLKTITAYQQDASATARLELWAIGIQLIQDNPIFGIGPDNFMHYAFNGPHDCYIQAAAEYGLPAAVVYCSILISGFISCINALRLSRKLGDGQSLSALSVTMMCLLTHITVQGFTTGFAHREFVYFIVAIAYCTSTIARKQAQQETSPVLSPSSVPLPSRKRLTTAS